MKDYNKYKNTKGLAKRWTDEAVYCYERRCRCSGCINNMILEHTSCKMKQTVIELVRRFGTPAAAQKLKF